jgi:uncharacterized protein (TIGR02265 family)
MAKTKGTGLVALKAFVRERFGEAGWQRLLEAIEPTDRAAVEMPVSISWYDLETAQRAVRALVKVLGDGNPQLAVEFGRHEAEHDLTSVQRFFLKMANPAYALEKAGQYWRRFADWGEWRVERLGSGGARATLKGCPHPEVYYCAELTGYLARMWELVGARDPHVRHTHCRNRGDQDCTWEGTWKSG